MKINKEKLNKQIETMNKEQLLDLCKSTTSIINDLQDKIDKAIDYLEHENFKRKMLGFSENKYLNNIKNETINILRGEDNE